MDTLGVSVDGVNGNREGFVHVTDDGNEVIGPGPRGSGEGVTKG